MKRRNFLQSGAALVAAPALPLPAFASAPAAAVNPNLYAWSAAIARTHGKCSAAMLKAMLHIDGPQAAALVNSLIRNGIIGQANAIGLSPARSVLPPATGIPKTTIKTLAPKPNRQATDAVQSVLQDADKVSEGNTGNDPGSETETDPADPPQPTA